MLRVFALLLLTGKLFQYSEPTSPWDLVYGVGATPTPALEGNEIGDAFAQFSDPALAMRTLEGIKRKNGFSGGRVYAGFTYRTGAHQEFRADAYVECGVSRSTSKDWDDVKKASVVHGTRERGLFRAFKLADRPARVRAIADCLHDLSDEMPPLKPARPKIERLYIDDVAYELGIAWLRSREPKGLPPAAREQYKHALRCMVTRAAEASGSTGTDVVVRAPTSEIDVTHMERVPVFPFGPKLAQVEVYDRTVEEQDLFMAVVNKEAVDFVWDVDEAVDAAGIWEFRMGFDNMILIRNGVKVEYDRFTMLFEGAMDKLPECRRRAGLFEVPDTRLPEMGAPVKCGN